MERLQIIATFCESCKQYHPITHFEKKDKSKGLFLYCKECRRRATNRNKDWYDNRRVK